MREGERSKIVKSSFEMLKQPVSYLISWILGTVRTTKRSHDQISDLINDVKSIEQ